MATTSGAISLVSVTSTTAKLVVGNATGGTAPYTYQWYRSTTTGFTPGAGNIITGATMQSLADSGLIPLTGYFYKNTATDAGSVASTSAQLAVNTTQSTPAQNVFAQSMILGKVDMPFNTETVSAMVDISQSGLLYPGQAVKIVDVVGGIPHVIGCTANTDSVVGFINYDIKSVAFQAGDKIEMSQSGNIIYLFATGPISRMVPVTLDVSSVGGVAQSTTSSGFNLVGYSYDKAPAAGTLIRVRLRSPSFSFA